MVPSDKLPMPGAADTTAVDAAAIFDAGCGPTSMFVELAFPGAQVVGDIKNPGKLTVVDGGVLEVKV